MYLENNANITLTSNITSDICAHIKSSDPNTYPNVLLVNTNLSRAEQEALINNNYQKFIYDGTYELKPVITSSVYTFLYAVSYVDGSNGKTGVDGGTGAKDNPFKTVSEAVDELRTQLNSGTYKNAIVYVAGTTEESSVINTEDASVSLSTLTIKQWPGKTDAVIKRGTVNDSIIKVSTNSALTLEDIEINGNNAVLSNINGAGLSIEGGSATATLTNVKIYGCKVRQDTTPPNVNTNYGQGGAIFAKGNLASLYLKGNTVIGSDITGALSEENSSNCAKEGGAIYFQTTSSRALEIEDTVVIKGNYALSNGGAIYMRQQSLSANIGGSIKNNAAGTAGGAIYNYGCTSVINGTISGNTSPSGSIYASVFAKIQLNAKSNIGPDDEVVLYRDPSSSSSYGQIYIGGALNAQSNPIKVSCENPDTSTSYVTGPNPLATRNEIPKLTYNGAFSFITSGDNLGKIEHAPLYVAGSGSGMTGSDSNPGTETQPLATVAAAVNKINNFGGTIYVAGTTTETNPINFAASATTKTFEIMTWPSKQKAVIKRANSQTSYMIKIENDNNVTIKDIEIDGSGISSSSFGESAGINITSTGALTLENVDIHDVISSIASGPVGGAIYAAGSFTMIGGSIKDCIIGTAASPAGSGGAIYKSGADYPCVLENVTFSGNKAEKGNGIYVASGSITLKGSTNLSTSTGDINDIYLYNSSSFTGSIKIDGTLSAATVAQITVPVDGSGNITRTDAVLVPNIAGSDEVEKSYKKFTLTKTGYELWEDGKMTPVVALNSSDGLGLLSSAYTTGVTTVIGRVSGTLNTSGNISVGSGKTLILQRAATATTAAIKFSDDDPAGSMFNVNRGKLVVTDIVLDGNVKDVSSAGSCIYATDGSTVTLNGATQIKDFYSLPYAARTGGAVFSDTDCTLNISDDVIISNNTTGIDFGMYNYAASGPAGGAICSKGTLNISGNVKITGNKLAWNERENLIPGGAIFAGGTTSITGNVEISSNNIMLITSDMYAYGAGIYVDGSLTINGNNVKICDNQSSKFRPELTSFISKGAGIYVAEDATLSLRGNVTISGNSNAGDTTEGPAIYSREPIDTSNILYVEGTGGVRVFGNKNNDDVVTGEEQITM